MLPRKPVLAYVLALADEEANVVSDEVRVALGDFLDGFVLTVLITVALGTMYYANRVAKKLRRSIRR